jgi:hypothetical protein
MQTGLGRGLKRSEAMPSAHRAEAFGAGGYPLARPAGARSPTGGQAEAETIVARLMRIIETGSDADALGAAEALMSGVYGGRDASPAEARARESVVGAGDDRIRTRSAIDVARLERRVGSSSPA